MEDAEEAPSTIERAYLLSVAPVTPPDVVSPPRGGLPPFNPDAEAAVIAAFLLADENVDGVVWCIEHLPAEDFFRETHRWAYEACLELAERGVAIRVVTLGDELERVHPDEVPGGWVAWCSEILGRFFTAYGVEAHARIVMRDAYYRRVIAAAGQVVQLAFEGGTPPERLHSDIIDIFMAIAPEQEQLPQLRALPL